MTPGISAVKKAGVRHTVHTYTHDPGHLSYGTEAAEKLGIQHDRVFKTLIVRCDGERLAVAVVPVVTMLNMKRMARACGAKKAELADTGVAERTTGYVLGGISPLGQKRRLPTVIDSSALQFGTMFVSAGRRGLEIELAPNDLQRLTGATFAEIRDQEGN